MCNYHSRLVYTVHTSPEDTDLREVEPCLYAGLPLHLGGDRVIGEGEGGTAP